LFHLKTLNILKVTENQTPFIWLTGMSGSGKSKLSSAVKQELTEQGLTVCIIDSDTVRESYQQKLGFSRAEVMQNNLHITSLCQKVRSDFDVILVLVISPFAFVRQKVRKLLAPNFHLVYLKTDLNSLKAREPKGLGQAADDGIITNLIGYSKTTPYEQPDDADLILDTGNQFTAAESKAGIRGYIQI
jgi:adenylylsulfate kinase